MTERTIEFTTFGPNRGATLTIGSYHFVDGVCSIGEHEAAKAASILCAYYDVCYRHDLEHKITEYDKKYPKFSAKESSSTISSTAPDTVDKPTQRQHPHKKQVAHE